jgi:hypothetical protein
LWTDGEWEHPAKIWKSEEYLAWLFNESAVKNSVVVNDRWGNDTKGKHGSFKTSEYGQGSSDTEGGINARGKNVAAWANHLATIEMKTWKSIAQANNWCINLLK